MTPLCQILFPGFFWNYPIRAEIRIRFGPWYPSVSPRLLSSSLGLHMLIFLSSCMLHLDALAKNLLDL